MSQIVVGNLVLDLAGKNVQFGVQKYHITPTSFELLSCLMQKAPAVVSVDELLQDVWQGRVVNRDTVKQQIKVLRDQLGGDSGIIESVRGYGYCINSEVVNSITNNSPIKNVSEAEAKLSARSESQIKELLRVQVNERPFTGKSKIVFWGLMLLVVAFGCYSLLNLRPKVKLPLKVAVLPFAQIDKDGNNLSSLVQDELTTALSRQKDVKVLSVSSVLHAIENGYGPNQYATELGVHFVLEGSIRETNTNYLVNIRIVFTKNGMTVWRDSLKNSKDRESLVSQINQSLVNFIAKKVDYIKS